MKKQVLIFLVMLWGAVSLGFAQPQGGAGHQQGHGGGSNSAERIRTMKIAYFTDKVGLTPEESEKFWPLYNQYWGERREVARKCYTICRRIEGNEAQKGDLDALLGERDAENGIVRRWAKEFMKVLSEEKVAKVFVAEESFKQYLLKQRAGK